MASAIVGALIAAACIAAVAVIRRKKLLGRCGGDCAGCAMGCKRGEDG